MKELWATFFVLCALIAGSCSSQKRLISSETPFSIQQSENSAQEGDIDRIIKKGERFFINGRQLEALAIFEGLVDRYPDDARGYYYCAMIKARQGKIQEAKELYGKAILLKPPIPEAFNNLAVLLQGERSFDQAEKLLLRAVELADDYYEAFFNLGYLYESWGKVEKAIKYYEDASRMNPEDPEPVIALCEIEAGMEKFDRAVYSCEKAVEMRPEDAIIELKYVEALRKTGRREEAKKQCEKMIVRMELTDKNHPEEITGVDVIVVFSLAREMRLLGNPAKALGLLEMLPKDAMHTFSFLTEVGQDYLQMGKCDVAVEYFKKARKVKPHSSQILIAIADSYSCMGKCSEAGKFYNLYLESAEEVDSEKRQLIKGKIKKCHSP